MNADARGLLALAAVAGGLVFFSPSQPTQKASVVAPKSQPSPKASAPSQRTQPVPRPRPPAAISRPERKAKQKARVRAPTAAQCAQLRLGLATIGRDGVIKEARARRYSATQVAAAISACGL